jgi:general secretion pathway protein M
LYTQLDLDAPQAKDDFVGVILDCQSVQPALRQLLHDLEAGMPFLVHRQLPGCGGDCPQDKLRLVISVSGQWQGAK